MPRPDASIGARVELAQPALMDEAIARLAPQVPGETDVYAIGIAGWAEQDVFIKELDGALAAFGKMLAAAGPHPAPGQSRRHGRADTGRGARELRRRGPRHRARDGPARGRAGVVHDLARLDRTASRCACRDWSATDLRPEDVAAVLDREGIRNRIVVVSACYSGVFVKPLANDNTIVLTAADEKSTSFGCSNEREWTYFGDAFFNQHLEPDVTLGGGVPRRQGHHRAVGGARRFDAVKPARALRAGADREARAAVVAPGPRRAA